VTVPGSVLHKRLCRKLADATGPTVIGGQREVKFTKSECDLSRKMVLEVVRSEAH
jgi:hypothetical protein